MLSPVELKKGESLRISIDVPKHGPTRIEAFVWHVRRLKSSSTQMQNWSAGMVLVKSDDIYARILAPAKPNVSVRGDRNVSVRGDPNVSVRGDPNVSVRGDPNDKSDELRSFKLRVQVRGEPRSRLLTLGAATEEQARELALADLDDSWSIIEIKRVPAQI